MWLSREIPKLSACAEKPALPTKAQLDELNTTILFQVLSSSCHPLGGRRQGEGEQGMLGGVSEITLIWDLL